MRIVVVSQPQPLVDLEEAKIALGEDGPDRDLLIEGLILAAQADLDGPLGSVGVTVAEQTVEVYYDTFDGEPLELPGGPLVGVPVVEYLDTSGATETLSPTTYSIKNGSRIVLASGASWPPISGAGSAVWATYDLGIADEADPRIGLMKTAIIMHVKMTMDMDAPEIYRRAIDGLTSSMRVWRV